MDIFIARYESETLEKRKDVKMKKLITQIILILKRKKREKRVKRHIFIHAQTRPNY